MSRLSTVEEIVSALAANPNATLDIESSVELRFDISRGAPFLRVFGATRLHVVAWESSQPHVVASAYAQLSLRGKGIIAKATAKVAVLLRGGAAASGGRQTKISITSAKDWCEYYGVTLHGDVAILFKALNANFKAQWHDFDYTPGTIPVAPDWDGGNRECGGGLHFSPSPVMALEFHATATRFVACPVKLADIAVHEEGEYPQKVKARGCCAAVYEVDRWGTPIGDVPPYAPPTSPRAKRAPKARAKRSAARAR